MLWFNANLILAKAAPHQIVVFGPKNTLIVSFIYNSILCNFGGSSYRDRIMIMLWDCLLWRSATQYKVGTFTGIRQLLHMFRALRRCFFISDWQMLFSTFRSIVMKLYPLSTRYLPLAFGLTQTSFRFITIC